MRSCRFTLDRDSSRGPPISTLIHPPPVTATFQNPSPIITPEISSVVTCPNNVKQFGATGAILLGTLLARQAILRTDQDVQLTEAELLEATGLTRHEQRTAIGRLREAKLLTTHRHAMFGKRNFRVESPSRSLREKGRSTSCG